MSSPSFHVRRWAAFAPGLPEQPSWLAWLAAPDLLALDGDAVPPLAELPAMTRRRLDAQGRAALQAAFWAQGDVGTGPVVFASRWGEIGRSVALLRQLAADEPLSPTAFSLSVHNAASAVYSISRADTSNYCAVSAGAYSAAGAVSEAVGLMSEGVEQVLVVSVESGLPEPYTHFEPHPVALRAWAALLQAGGDMTLSTAGCAGATTTLPPDLEALRFLSGHLPELRQGGWHWARHG